MERGLLWLPLLGVFTGLAYAGWNEYQRLEAYKLWAKDFLRSKFDIYAILGQRDRTIVWGKPSRNGPIDLQTFCLDQVQSIQVLADEQPIDPEHLPRRYRRIALEFTFADASPAARVPFTELDLALRWCQALRTSLTEGRDRGDSTP